MTLCRLAIVTVLGAAAFISLLSAFQYGGYSQYAYEMQRPVPDPPDASVKGEYTFARLRYRSGGGGRGGFGGRRGGGRSSWGTDSNKAERIFVQGVRRLSRIDSRSVEEIIDIDSDEIYNWPWIYAVEVGRWDVSESQAKRLREYFNRGGFLMVDDFHGTAEWENFAVSLSRIFPDRPVLDLENDHAIFHALFNLKDRVQVPGVQYLRSGETYEQDGIEPKWRAILDENGRVQVAICHNMDLGDAWEYADLPEFPEKFSTLAYQIGLNYLIYAMTH